MSQHLSINALWKLTGIDRRTIEKRILLAGVSATDDGYPTRDALRAIYGAPAKKTEDMVVSEARIFAANARTAEVKAAKAEDKVIESNIVDLAWSEITILIAQKLDLLPSKFRSRYVVGMSEDDAAKIIEQDLEDVRNDLSKPITYEQSEDTPQDDEPGAGESQAEAEAAD